MSHILQPFGFPRAKERCVAIARQWLTTCGKSSCEYMFGMLVEFTDEQLADRCIRFWGLDQSQGDENDITWFEANETDRDTLVTAFAEVRAWLASQIPDPGSASGAPPR